LNATWIVDDESINNVMDKVNGFSVYIGIPPNMRNITILNEYYYNLTFNEGGTFTSNLGNLVEFDWKRRFNEYIGVMPDLFDTWPTFFRDESLYRFWLTGVNAFYMPSYNAFCIPNTISQKPFFTNKDDIPKVLNYGGIGAIIGHEISHGFDPRGSYFNYNGTFLFPNSIYSNATLQGYNDLLDCFIDQYSRIIVSNNITVDGSITITENVADNGGIAASLHAYNKWKSNNINSDNIIGLPGISFNDNQLFWYAHARNWCAVWRPDYFKNWKDVHAPYIQRVNGVVMNSQHFADAFNCPIGSPMNPVDKCVLL